MPFSPFIEEIKTKVTGTFTGSIVDTHEIDKYRQGVEHFDAAHPRYYSNETVKVASQKLADGTLNFPQDIFPQKFYEDEAIDTTEQYGIWHEGFLEPLTIRDEVTFNSIESPQLAHSIKADVFETTDVIEQSIDDNRYINVKQRTFFESGSQIRITTTGTVFNSNTSSLTSIIVEENYSGNRKYSAAAGYDYSQVILTGTMRQPAIRAIYRGQDSIAFRDKAPYQGRGVFLLADSTNLNLSGTNFSFDKGVKAATTTSIFQYPDYVDFVRKYLPDGVKYDYPPIVRENTDFRGKREWTFIDSAPSGAFPTYIRYPDKSGYKFETSSIYNKLHYGSIYEHNLQQNPLIFKEIFHQGLGIPGTGTFGNRDKKTNEWANTILRFYLTESSGKYMMISTTGTVATTETNVKYILDGKSNPNKVIAYDFVGASVGSSNVSTQAPGWKDFGGTAGDKETIYYKMLHGHYQHNGTISTVSQLTNNPVLGTDANVDYAPMIPQFFSSRGYRFNHPFILKQVSIDLEIFAANSASFWGLTSQTTGEKHYINWTFRPIVSGSITGAGSSLGTVLAFTDSVGTIIVTQSVQVPHATFIIAKSFGNADQLRNRNISLANSEDDTRFPAGIAVSNNPIMIDQILFTASFGLTGSAVGYNGGNLGRNGGEFYYPKFDYYIGSNVKEIHDPLSVVSTFGVPNTPADKVAFYLSGTKDVRQYFITESAHFIKEPIKQFNVTKSLGEEFSLLRDYSLLSSQLNLINKDDTIYFFWPSNTLTFGRSAGIFENLVRQQWCVPFGVRDMYVSFQGYIPRAGEAIQDSLNQNLTTNAIHEDVHEIIHDEFETFFSAAYTGSMLSRLVHPSDWHQGNIDFALHGYKIFDPSEKFVDSFTRVQTGSAEIQKGSVFDPGEKIKTTSKIFTAGFIGDFNEYNRIHSIHKYKPGKGGIGGPGTTTSSHGFRYGIMNTQSMNNSAVFRYNRFGQFRDMLEQRLYARFVGTLQKDKSEETTQVSSFAVFISSSTVNLGANPLATSSEPYADRIGIIPSSGPTGAPYK